jgi:hypothetical protein
MRSGATMKSATRQPIIIEGAFGLFLVISGMMELSATRRWRGDRVAGLPVDSDRLT